MRNLKLYLLLLALAFYGLNANAQHNSVVSQYMFNMFTINPAYAGAKDYSTINAFYRSQWVGFEGAPVTQSLTFHKPIKKTNMGVGLQLFNDKIGVTKEFGMMLNGAYSIKTPEMRFSMGLSAGFKNFSSNWTDLVTSQDGDFNFSYDTQNRFRPEFGVGAYYQSKNWYAGFSIPYLFNARLSDNNETINTYYDAKNTNYLLTGGTALKLNESLVLKPSMLFKFNPASSMQMDINSNLIIQNRFWIGASYRHQDAVLGIFEVQVNEKIKTGYSFDFTLSEIQRYSNGTHEFSVEYVVGRKPSLVNPRFAPKLYF